MYKVSPSHCKFVSPVNAFAPVAVTILLFAPFVKVGLPDEVPVTAPAKAVAVTVPLTCSLVLGFETPIPTLPPLNAVIISLPFT